MTGSTNVANGIGAHVKAFSTRFGTVEGRNEFGRTGQHRRDGWFVAAAPGIQRGSMHDVSLDDLATTMAAILGVVMPEVDGRVVGELAGHT